MITGKTIDIEAGPNWDDDLGGSPVYAANDPNLAALDRRGAPELSRSSVSSSSTCRASATIASTRLRRGLPRGAIFKRGEDGWCSSIRKRAGLALLRLGLPLQEGLLQLVAGKSEKCILCFPRLETGQAPACFHSCVGRIRYLGVLLYDPTAWPTRRAWAIPISSTRTATSSSIRAIRRSARGDAQRHRRAALDACERSPVYRYVKEWKLALPLHAEFRTP